MLIRIGYDISFELANPTPLITMLYVHPSRRGDLQSAEEVTVEPGVPVHQKARWKFTAMARVFAAISCISPLPFVDASISRRVMSPVTWATLGFHLRLTRWILAHGSKFSSVGNGTLLMRVTTNGASAVFSWPSVATPLTLH